MEGGGAKKAGLIETTFNGKILWYKLDLHSTCFIFNFQFNADILVFHNQMIKRILAAIFLDIPENPRVFKHECCVTELKVPF